MRTAILFLTLVSSLPAFSSDSPLRAGLEPGPHAVGFKAVPVRDFSRGGEPMILAVWYPARAAAGGARMTWSAYGSYENYDRATLAPPTPAVLAAAAERTRQFFERPFNFPEGGKAPDEAWARLDATQTDAVFEAAALPGSFPLLVGNSGVRTNAISHEFLASHGYIVVVAAALNFPSVTPPESTEWSARNVEFALAWSRGVPHVNHEQIGLMGFSGGGFGPYIVSMRNRDVDAFVAIESAIYVRQFAPGILEHDGYAPTKLRVPMLHMFRAELSRTDEDLTEFRRLRYSERYRFLLDEARLVHQDFSSLGPASVILGIRGDAAPLALRASAAVNRQLLRFFNAHLKGDAAAKASLVAGDATITVEHLAAITPAPDQAQAREIVKSLGVEAGMKKLLEARAIDPDAELFTNAGLGALGWSFVNDPNLDAARAVESLLARQAPDTVYLLNHSGNVRLAEGKEQEAITLFEKALAALPQATTMSENERTQSKQNIQAKIDRLRKAREASSARLRVVERLSV